MPRPGILLLAAAAALLGSCGGSQAGDPSPLSVKVSFLDASGESSAFPRQIARLVVKVTPYDAANVNCNCAQRTCKKVYTADPATGEVALTDVNGDGQRSEAFIENLPYFCPMALEIFAYLGAAGKVSYYGRQDGIVLTQGKRTFVKMSLYEKLSRTMRLDTGTIRLALFGHTATRLDKGPLPDHRVLVTGGFSAVQSVNCAGVAELPGCPEGTDCWKCFVATAAKDLYLFDQGSGKMRRPVPRDAAGRPMTAVTLSRPRAFHSATLLADGRVVIAGGVDRALFVFRDNDAFDGSEEAAAGWEIVDVIPLPDPAGGYSGAQNNFEIFDPTLNPDQLDVDRDGDLERGGIVAGEAIKGMVAKRFLQATAYYPWEGDWDPAKERKFVQVGGRDNDAADSGVAGSTVDVFDSATNGFITSTIPSLLVRRTFPAAVTLGGALWIFGGSRMPGEETAPNTGIGEKWVMSFTTKSWNAPVALYTSAEGHPEYVRLFSEAISLPGTTPALKRVLVTGWYGARCSTSAEGAETPTFTYTNPDDETPIPTHICSPAAVPGNLVFDVSTDPVTISSTLYRAPGGVAQAFAATTLLGCAEGARGGWVLQSGGIASTTFAPALVSGKGALFLYDQSGVNVPLTAALDASRMWHRAVELKGGAVLFVGGARVDPARGTFEIVSDTELLSFEGQCGDGVLENVPASPAYEGACCSVDAAPPSG